MTTYKVNLEFIVDSVLTGEELAEHIQPCLVKADADGVPLQVVLDNKNSEFFAVTDYTEIVVEAIE